MSMDLTPLREKESGSRRQEEKMIERMYNSPKKKGYEVVMD